MGASILQAMVSIFVLTLSLRMKFYFFVQSYKISPVDSSQSRLRCDLGTLV
jgi:hypothetical protein